MPVLTAAELTAMKTVQEAHMHDTCVVQVYSASANAIGEMVATYTDGSAIACGVRWTTSDEDRTEDQTVPALDVEIRLPAAQTVTTRDRIKVTKRYGATLATPWVFAVQGETQLGPSGILVNGSKVS